MVQTPRPNRWQRFSDWDARPLRLDNFAREDAANGFAAFNSPADPKPGVAIAGGQIESMDGVLARDFDIIDLFIARHHLDPEIAEEAMAIDSAELARRLVDMNVPRTELVRLARGLTPAKLADVVSRLNALEIAFAYSKMRARRTPGNQAHGTNAKDDPLQMAADAATAVGFGFDEIETTMRVSRNAWSNALACAVGAAVGRWGALLQCSSLDKRAGMRLQILRHDNATQEPGQHDAGSIEQQPRAKRAHIVGCEGGDVEGETRHRPVEGNKQKCDDVICEMKGDGRQEKGRGIGGADPEKNVRRGIPVPDGQQHDDRP